MSKEAKAEMITQSTILDMGWTKSMIVKLLPEPILKPNPHYRCAAPMKLWIKQDVLNEMETEDFKKELEKANRRKASSQKSKNTKAINLKGKMQQIADSITVTVLPTEKLEEETLKSQESRICERLSYGRNIWDGITKTIMRNISNALMKWKTLKSTDRTTEKPCNVGSLITSVTILLTMITSSIYSKAKPEKMKPIACLRRKSSKR